MKRKKASKARAKDINVLVSCGAVLESIAELRKRIDDLRKSLERIPDSEDPYVQAIANLIARSIQEDEKRLAVEWRYAREHGCLPTPKVPLVDPRFLAPFLLTKPRARKK